MRITFLGTGTSQGVPVIGCVCDVCLSLDFRNKRLRTSIHVDVQGKSFIVDTGPDFRQQMLRENIERVDAVLLTHAHRDHTSGIDDIRAYNFKQNMDIPVYSSQNVLEQIQLDFSYIFHEHQYPGLPRLALHKIDTKPFAIDNVTITPIPVMHLKLPILGFRFGNFSYITDANFISDASLELLKGTEILVLNALQVEKHVSHFNLEEALAMVEKIKPGKTYFTHISHKLGLHQDVEKKLPAGVALAFDGMQVDL